MEFIRPSLVVLKGGKKDEPERMAGPVTRLGLQNRIGSQLTSRQWACVAGAKVLLLASLLYVMFG